MRRLSIVIVGLLAVALPAGALSAAQQRPGPGATARDAAALDRLLRAEDARGHGSDGLVPLVDGLASRDTLIRRVAVRGLGRQQRPDLGRTILAALADPVAAVRAEAANALAQSFRRVRRGVAATDTAQLSVDGARDALVAKLAVETDAAAAAGMAEALGRLPYADSGDARPAVAAISARVRIAPVYGAVHGFYTLALARRAVGGLAPESITLLKTAARSNADAAVRRLSVLTLAVMGALDSGTVLRATRDTDEQVRRLALRGIASLDSAARDVVVQRALADPSAIVRVDAIGAARSGSRTPDCSAIAGATADPHPYVALTAIDSLGAPCRDAAAAGSTLARIATGPRRGLPNHVWQRPAHALVALAHTAPAVAESLVPRAAASARWQERAYAARAAAVLADTTRLYRLAADSNANVREVAITGLARRVGHGADSVYLRVLTLTGYQSVLAAAQALAGSPDSVAVLAASLDALDRLTRARSENARDPRLALLQRIGETGGPDARARLEPYLADFDTTVAATAGSLLSRWTGVPVTPRALPLPIQRERLAAVFLAPDVRFRVTMAAGSGGDTFTLRLLTNEAPATAAHLIRLARHGYYEGAALQRVEPNFVVQGGGPGETEYIGDTVFMRDEVAWRTHARGTLGISSRGRDTGDAQWFINLVDNPLLDHEYTVFGTIVSGRDVAERIVEGDRIGRVEVIGAP